MGLLGKKKIWRKESHSLHPDTEEARHAGGEVRAMSQHVLE